MKVISVWNPWATLIVHGFKIFETRSWPAPKSMLGQTLGIASTRKVNPVQRAAFDEPLFAGFYFMTGLPVLHELPHGYLLGTVTLDSVEHITEEFLLDITEEERAYGWHDIGRYAWRLKNVVKFDEPIPIMGKQGIWDYTGFDDGADSSKAGEAEIHGAKEGS